jgi:CubicO group peptidase (beta-lactamase class C family)
MTKPITGTAIMILQDEGKLNVADPVAKYIPEFANLSTPSGKPANLTITQILAHTSGLGEASAKAAANLRTLAELVPVWLAAMLSPGTFGHGGAWGTQAWIDPIKGVAYLLFVQRANFPNSDASEVRQVFQQAAASALARQP